MANTIVLKRSAVESKVPTTEDLALGEIAINTYDGVMYYKKDNGAQDIIPVMKADMSNATPGTGILCGGGWLRRREIVSSTSAIVMTNGDGAEGDPTLTFTPGNVSLSEFAGGADSILPPQTGNSGKVLTTNGTTTSWSAASGGGAPAGNNREVQYNNAGTAGGASNVEISSTGNLILTTSASDTPADTEIVVFNESNGFPAGLSTRNSYGVETALQRTLSTCEIGWWNPPGNATTVPGVLGIAAPTAQGTATARPVALTNIATRAKRLGYVSSSSATGAMCGHYWGVAQFAMGNGAGLGGFYMNWRFCISDAVMVPEAVMMIGVTSLTSAPTAVNLTTHVNCIAVGHTYNATNLSIFYGGSAAQTPISLGANFPVTKTDLYEFSLYVPNNTDNVAFYRVKRLGTAYEATGTLTGTAGVVLPASSTLLAPRAWRTNNSVQTAVALDIAHFYTETQQY